MSCAALAHPAGIPAFALPVLSRGERHIGAAIGVSLLIHGVALGWLPGLQRPADEATPLPPLSVRLAVPLQPRPPEAVAAPAAVSPAPTFAPTLAATSIRRAAAVPQVVTPVLSQPIALPERQETPAPQPAAAAPIVEAPRPIVASPPRPAAPDPALLAAYGRELAGAVASRQRYPRLAQLRQWQGTAVLQLELAAAGELLAVRVLSSSGHEILDQQALEMVRAAAPLPALPEAFAGRALTVDVPVVFRLAS